MNLAEWLERYSERSKRAVKLEEASPLHIHCLFFYKGLFLPVTGSPMKFSCCSFFNGTK